MYLTYEYLLISEHYDSAKVFVFYGDGTDYNSSNVRYKKELHNWGQITDYDNSYSTMNSIIPSLNNVISDKDNLLFYWVVGHGDKMGTSNDDNYRVMIEHNSYYDSEYVYKTQLVALINSITPKGSFWL